MKTQHLIFLVCAMALVGAVFSAGFIVGTFRHDERAWKNPVMAEFRVHYYNLERTDLSPQLREYLKSRLYYLAYRLDARDLIGFRFNFGPIDEKLLGGATGIKGPETELDTYTVAMTRHKQRDSRR
jgi:hypothetical protein